MRNAFSYYFRQACNESASEAMVRSQQQSERYQSLEQDLQALAAQLREKLGDQDAPLLQLEELTNQQDCLEEDWIYRQAFHDCLYLLDWMGLLNLRQAEE